MALRQFNPTSPSRRELVLVDRSELHKGRPEKSLVEGLSKTGGAAVVAASRFVSVAAVPNAYTAKSTSNAASGMCPRRSNAWSMTLTGPPSSP